MIESPSCWYDFNEDPIRLPDGRFAWEDKVGNGKPIIVTETDLKHLIKCPQCGDSGWGDGKRVKYCGKCAAEQGVDVEMKVILKGEPDSHQFTSFWNSYE